MTFTWTAEPRHRGGTLWVLHNPDIAPSPLVADDRLAVAGHKGGRVWEARFWVDYGSIIHAGGSGSRKWFVWHPSDTGMVIASDSRGNYRRFASHVSAQRLADQLNRDDPQ